MSPGARLREVADWAWYAPSPGASSLRTALTPLSAAFGAMVRLRNRRFDESVRCDTLADAALPALSVGNLTVGGTGKTPVASWFAARLRARGAAPALILRGYGDDEWRVHALLTPELPVVVAPDRVAGMREAQSRGADCAVLDDAFQHRQARRVADVVLVSADRFHPLVRLLPAGPYREPLASLGRATAVLVTVKAADTARIERTVTAVQAAAPMVRVAVVRLVPDVIRSATDGEVHAATSWLPGRSVVLASAIADPDAFASQVAAAGARIVRHHRYPDHHAFTEAEVAELALAGRAADGVLCTLKDAVKLGPRWPRIGSPLWYVSQTLVVVRGAEVLEQECDRVLAARTTAAPTAG